MTNIPNRKNLTKNLYIGEKILREFKSEYPNLESNVRYSALIEKHEGDKKYDIFFNYLKGKAYLSGFKVQQMRNEYSSQDKKVESIKKLVKQHKTANCKECSYIIQDKLAQNGISAQTIRLCITPNDKNKLKRTHAFTVIGMDSNSEITIPNSWGKNSVIIDGWANIVKNTQDGIKYMKDLFNYNPENEICSFEKYGS